MLHKNSSEGWPLRLITAIMAVVMIASCSPRVFEKETARFRDAAIGVELAWTGLHDRVDALNEAERERERIRDNWGFSISEQCASFASDLASPPEGGLEGRQELIMNCTLFQRQTDKPAPGVFVDPVDRQLLPYAKAISDYAAALAALTAAEDETAFRTAAVEVGASLGTAGDALKQLRDTDIDITKPISSLASVYAKIRLTGIERRKYNTLRDVVVRTDGAIQRMTERMAKVEVHLRQRLLLAQYRAIVSAERDLRALTPHSPRAERVKRQQAVINQLLEYRAYARTLLRGGVSYGDVGEVHAQLLSAVRSPDDFQLARLAVERLKSIGEAAEETATALGLKD